MITLVQVEILLGAGKNIGLHEPKSPDMSPYSDFSVLMLSLQILQPFLLESSILAINHVHDNLTRKALYI